MLGVHRPDLKPRGATIQSRFWGWLVLALALGGCAHPAERALRGRWLGESVENFNQDELAEATAWARGTMLEFKSSSLTVAIPAEESRTGTYLLSSIADRTVKLRVLDLEGQESDMELVVDDEDHLRWLLGDGRSVVMKRED
jgi:hypothetical protein